MQSAIVDPSVVAILSEEDRKFALDLNLKEQAFGHFMSTFQTEAMKKSQELANERFGFWLLMKEKYKLPQEQELQRIS